MIDISSIDIKLPPQVEMIIDRIMSAGFEAFAVGGCVRDSILGRTPDDWDITTNAKPEQVKALFSRTVDTGIKHGTVTVMVGKEGFEVTTYRIDGEYLDGRHPESVEFAGELIEDLKRRDFTINACAYNKTRGVVDEFDGIGDLNRGVIRCVGNPEDRFTEDALRMMRAIRFSAQLNFTIDEDTFRQITLLSPSITKVSMERIQVELQKTLMSMCPDRVVLYQTTGIFRAIIPKLDELLASWSRAEVTAALLNAPKKQAFRYAALLVNLGKDAAKDILKQLRLDNHTINTVYKLIEASGLEISETRPDMRRLMNRYSKELVGDILTFEEALIFGKEQATQSTMDIEKEHLRKLRGFYEDILCCGDCTSISELDITGNDLKELGITGVNIGKKLNYLLDMVMDDPGLNKKSTLIKMIIYE